jgi:hypothetical protein
MMRDEIFMALKIQVLVFWVMTMCTDVIGKQHFRGPWCPHLQGEDGGSMVYWYPTTSIHFNLKKMVAARASEMLSYNITACCHNTEGQDFKGTDCVSFIF